MIEDRCSLLIEIILNWFTDQSIGDWVGFIGGIAGLWALYLQVSRNSKVKIEIKDISCSGSIINCVADFQNSGDLMTSLTSCIFYFDEKSLEFSEQIYNNYSSKYETHRFEPFSITPGKAFRKKYIFIGAHKGINSGVIEFKFINHKTISVPVQIKQW